MNFFKNFFPNGNKKKKEKKKKESFNVEESMHVHFNFFFFFSLVLGTDLGGGSRGPRSPGSKFLFSYYIFYFYSWTLLPKP